MEGVRDSIHICSMELPEKISGICIFDIKISRDHDKFDLCVCQIAIHFVVLSWVQKTQKCLIQCRRTPFRIVYSLVDDVEGAVDDVVELEGVVRLREALQVQRVVLVSDDGDADDHVFAAEWSEPVAGEQRR